jgi:hypothetical protein
LLDKDNNIIPLDSNAEWINPESDIKIFYVEQIDKTHEAQKVDDKKETFANKSIKYGCFTILILLVIAMFVGLWENCFFNLRSFLSVDKKTNAQQKFWQYWGLTE